MIKLSYLSAGACLLAIMNLHSFQRTDLDEREKALSMRTDAAMAQTLNYKRVNFSKLHNEDEKKVKYFAASFSKALEHDKKTGLLTKSGQKNYKRLLKAIKTSKQKDFNKINRAKEAARKLVNPQNSFAFSLKGSDSSLFKTPKPPRLQSRKAAIELLEVYLKSIARDVRFEDYGTGLHSDNDGSGQSITDTVAAILDSLGDDFKGPRNAQGKVDASVLFRGTGQGPLVGPYVSQFLLLPVRSAFQEQLAQDQLVPVAQQREFGVSWDDFLAIQNGAVPKDFCASDFNGTRLPITGRDIGTYVHFDGPYEAYYNAVRILAQHGFPFSSRLPYHNSSVKNEDAFNTMGVPDLFTIIAEAAHEALKAAWVHKWRVHRRLRPEAMAGLAHLAKKTGKNSFDLHDVLFKQPGGHDVLKMVFERNKLQSTLGCNPLSEKAAQTYLLGLMYPEGSPVHPAYPAGHAVIAGACTTVIKAFVEDTALFRDTLSPVKPDPLNPNQLVVLPAGDANKMTVGGELDKLASNIALARNFAGVHYRTDGDYGIELGEEVAIRLLRDRARTYHEDGFKGFELTKRNGKRITIKP